MSTVDRSRKGHTAAVLAQLPTDECVIWPGALSKDGYGQHRAVWVKATGNPLPKRPMNLDHLCRNRSCVNPAHLELVTHRENMFRSRQTHCAKGHLFDEANTYIYREKRRCRACRRLCMAEWHAKNGRPKDEAA